MSAPEVAPAAPRILIADDSRIVRATIARHITPRFPVSEAVDGEEAWRQIEETGQVRLFKSYHEDYPDGGQKRDFLYVKDAVAMTLHLGATKKAGGLFNIGSGQAQTWLELVRPIFEALGREERIEFIEMPEALRSQYQYFTRADITKLKSTGYVGGVTPLRDAVMDYVSHYLVPGKHFGDGAGD